MRKLLLITATTLIGSVLTIGAADAQQSRRGAATMEGPTHPCRTVAMAFDQALRDRIGPAVGNGGQFPEATHVGSVLIRPHARWLGASGSVYSGSG